MNLMEVQNVKYSYERGKTVLRDVNARFEAGRMYAILGPSGCGKTTLLSLLGGLDSPAAGRVLYCGEDIAKTGLADHRRCHIAFIFQNYNLIDYLTPAENVALTAALPALPVLEELGLTAQEATRSVLKLSGGQQQRVAVARALASDAAVILADEPTGNLDEASASEITAVLKRSAHEAGKCVVVVTHSLALAQEADEILELRRGELQTLPAGNLKAAINRGGRAAKNKRT